MKRNYKVDNWYSVGEMAGGRMENIQKVKPKYVVKVCPNCGGRATNGYEKRPCATCAHTEHPGVIYIPAEEVKGGYER